MLDYELTEKHEEIDSLEARLVTLKKDKDSLNQRINGLKNGNAQKSDKIAKLSTLATTSS